MTITQITNVSISETGMEYRTPSSPNHRGSRRANPTPNSTSRTMETEAALFRPNGFHVAQIPDRQNSRDDLPQHRSRRAHHSPAKNKDEDGVQNDIGGSSRQGRGHGELGASIGADDGIECLTEHIKRDTQGDPEKIFLCVAEGFFVDPFAEQSQDRCLKNKIKRTARRAGLMPSVPASFFLIISGNRFNLETPSSVDAPPFSPTAGAAFLRNGNGRQRRRASSGVDSSGGPPGPEKPLVGERHHQ